MNEHHGKTGVLTFESEKSKSMQKWAGTLERNRKMKLMCAEGKTVAEIAKTYDLCRQRVYGILRRGEQEPGKMAVSQVKRVRTGRCHFCHEIVYDAPMGIGHPSCELQAAMDARKEYMEGTHAAEEGKFSEDNFSEHQD